MNNLTANLGRPLLFSMYRALVGIGLVCAILTASVYLITMPFIKANKTQALHHAIVSVLGDVHEIQVLRWQDERFEAIAVNQATLKDRIFIGYDQQGKSLGIAVVANGMGYQDSIELIYGYAPKEQKIKGISILENRETPGLGNRIASDATFLQQFHHFDVHLDNSATRLANDIRIAKKGQSIKAGQIDSISGATISSKAVAKILNSSAQHWLPLLQAALSKQDLSQMRTQPTNSSEIKEQ